MVMITQKRLRELVHYEPETGVFIAIKRRGKVIIGTKLGWIADYGRMLTFIDGKFYKLHRLAWLYVYGNWPDLDLDHINGDPSDNRICNLREATKSQNAGNSRRPITNKSGFKGVYWHKKANKWTAQIKFEDKRTHLGLFGTPEEAHAAYIEAAIKLHGAFARAT